MSSQETWFVGFPTQSRNFAKLRAISHNCAQSAQLRAIPEQLRAISRNCGWKPLLIYTSFGALFLKNKKYCKVKKNL